MSISPEALDRAIDKKPGFFEGEPDPIMPGITKDQLLENLNEVAREDNDPDLENLVKEKKAQLREDPTQIGVEVVATGRGPSQFGPGVTIGESPKTEKAADFLERRNPFDDKNE